MTEIRKYEEKDFDGVRYACLNSEGGIDDKELCAVVLSLFCDYYIENEPQNCFVVSHNGKAVGYVICAENYENFKPVYDEKYVPEIEKYDKKYMEWARGAYILQEKFKEEYPAHLHIDILPEYQRLGWGGKLINSLVNHLKEKGIKGVMLTTGTGNETANNFYKKYGFEILEILGTDIAFGMKL